MELALSFMSINIINSQFIAVIIMGLFIGAAAGYVGSLMLGKKMALAGGALGHLTLPGIALALIYGFDVFWGALMFLAIGIVMIWWLEKETKLSLEALTAVVFASSLSVAWLFLPENEKAQALIGDISHIHWSAILLGIILSAVVIMVIYYIYRQMVLAIISEDLAKTEGVNLKKYNFIYLLSVALIVALGVRVVGGLMTAALLAIPAATSRNLSRSLSGYAYGSILWGGLSVGGGVIVASWLALPAGPLIIIISSLFFLISVIAKLIMNK